MTELLYAQHNHALIMYKSPVAVLLSGAMK